jgi:hypothetical protein
MSSEQHEVATATIHSASTFRRSDPFNWPTMGRADLMSLSKLDEVKDIVQTRTMANRYRKRDFSNNLNSSDIEGKFQPSFNYLGASPKVWAPRTVNKPDLY